MAYAMNLLIKNLKVINKTQKNIKIYYNSISKIEIKFQKWKIQQSVIKKNANYPKKNYRIKLMI